MIYVRFKNYSLCLLTAISPRLRGVTKYLFSRQAQKSAKMPFALYRLRQCNIYYAVLFRNMIIFHKTRYLVWCRFYRACPSEAEAEAEAEAASEARPSLCVRVPPRVRSVSPLPLRTVHSPAYTIVLCFILFHHHHQPINVPTAEAEAFLIDHPQGE
jgi:hypothetical protein